MNAGLINELVGSFPHEEYVLNLQQHISQFQTLQTGFETHFRKTVDLTNDALQVSSAKKYD